MPKRDRLSSMRRLEDRPRTESQSGNERKSFPRLQVFFSISWNHATIQMTFLIIFSQTGEACSMLERFRALERSSSSRMLRHATDHADQHAGVEGLVGLTVCA